MLQQVSQKPDFNLYLVQIFANMPKADEIVRQRAGLLLKNAVNRDIPQDILEYVKAAVLQMVQDPARSLRHTAGSVITTICQRHGVSSWLAALEGLCESLANPNPDVRDGAWSALEKVCEDAVEFVKQLSADPADPRIAGFLQFSRTKMLPLFFQLVGPQQPLVHRQYGCKCINHFGLNFMFMYHSMDVYLPEFAGPYIQMLGSLATDTNSDIVKCVCQGFCFVVGFGADKIQGQEAVLCNFMLQACQHPEYEVRLSALEFWPTACYNEALHSHIAPVLTQLVPVLLTNMVYSDSDFATMDPAMLTDDNSSVPDQQHDIAPRSHYSKEEQDEDDQPTTWGSDWTVRKAAASSLDNCAVRFEMAILPLVLPLIEQRLAAEQWDVRESAVLALGAIAAGCQGSLQSHLPNVLRLLLGLCKAKEPLLRSISCWAVSRFGEWISSDDVACEALPPVVATILPCVLDRNKRVQEAAISAFATLEESARGHLNPFLGDITQTFARAFQMYQAKNLLILYDAVGTLAECVGQMLNNPTLIQTLVPPLINKFETTQDRSLVPCMEALGSVLTQLGPSVIEICPKVAQKCIGLVTNTLMEIQAYNQLQAQDRGVPPDRNIMACALDVLSNMCDGLKDRTGEVLQVANFVPIVAPCCRDEALGTKQSGFALMGDLAKYSFQHLQPVQQEVLQLALSHLSHPSPNCANNAIWSLGEMCTKLEPAVLNPVVGQIVQQACTVLTQSRHHQLAVNAALSLGRLGLAASQELAQLLPQYMLAWCNVMRLARVDGEKVQAFQGFLNVIKLNPQAATQSPEVMKSLFEAVATFFPPLPQAGPFPGTEQISPQLRELLLMYKTQMGAGWPEFAAGMVKEARTRLTAAGLECPT